MANRSFPHVGSPIATAGDWGDIFREILSNGVVFGTLNEYAVTAGGGFALNIASGKAFVDGVVVTDSASQTKTLDAASGNPRYDRIVLRMNRNSPGSGVVHVIKGTPAASNHQKPALSNTESIVDVPLAAINVPGSGVTITSAMIEDERKWLGPKAFGSWLSWSPNPTPDPQATFSITTSYLDHSEYKVVGDTCFVSYAATLTLTGASSQWGIRFNLPLSPTHWDATISADVQNNRGRAFIDQNDFIEVFNTTGNNWITDQALWFRLDGFYRVGAKL